MSFFSRLFSKTGQLEKELEQLYSPTLSGLMGIPPLEARKIVSSLISDAKNQSQKLGTDKIPRDYFLQLVLCPSTEEGKAEHAAKEQDGVNIDDYSWWWGMTDLERRVMIKMDELHRMAAYLRYQSEGDSKDEAMRKIRKLFPIFGDCMDSSVVGGDDRALPNELKDRVNTWAMENGHKLESLVAKHSTMNAAIRSQIRQGKL